MAGARAPRGVGVGSIWLGPAPLEWLGGLPAGAAALVPSARLDVAHVRAAGEALWPVLPQLALG